MPTNPKERRIFVMKLWVSAVYGSSLLVALVYLTR